MMLNIMGTVLRKRGIAMRNGQGSNRRSRIQHDEFYEETAAEVISPYDVLERETYPPEMDVTQSGGKLIGYGALFFSILSFFIYPVILGVIALVMGFIALRRGEISIGSWAVAISTLSLLISLFFLPFF